MRVQVQGVDSLSPSLRLSASARTPHHALALFCRPYLQACLFDEGLQDSLASVRKALKDSALSAAFVRHAPAEMAVLEQIEDHVDRRAQQPGTPVTEMIGYLESCQAGSYRTLCSSV